MSLAAQPCPCGSAVALSGCCGPLLDGHPADTAEALMRSRYTAFAVGDADHLFRTWHPRTRPATVELDDSTRWTGLVVEATTGGGLADSEGRVTFRASFTSATGTSGELHERSRFVRRGGRWVYLDGVTP